MKKIALIKSKNGIWKSFENILLQKNYNVKVLDPFLANDLEIILNNKWDALIWSAKHNPKIKKLAKKIIYLFDEEVKIDVYPNYNSYWHYDDKVAQFYLFTQYDFPIPNTKVFYNKKDAFNFFEKTEYPLIFKSAEGAGSTNVSIINSKMIAKYKVRKIFGKGAKTFFRGEAQKGYLLIQEFEKNNLGDYRLVCYGDEILGFFRDNREDEPLASGSRKFTFKEIPEDLLNLVYQCSCKLNYKVMSYDIIKNTNGEWVITEISVIYGDIKDDVYNKAPVYKRTKDNNWERVVSPGNHFERVATYIINSWSNRG